LDFWYETIWQPCFRQRSLERKTEQAPNPTIVSYNASVVRIYDAAASSLARFENKTKYYTLEKRSSLLQQWRCGCKFKCHSIGSCLKRYAIKWDAIK
jgi:hypothetical protein